MLKTLVRRTSIMVAVLVVGLPLPAAAADPSPPDPFDIIQDVQISDGVGTLLDIYTEETHVVHVLRDANQVGETVPTLLAAGSPAATLNCGTQDLLHIFAVDGSNGHMKVIWQTSIGSSTWRSSWLDMGGSLTSNPAVYDNDQGRMELFARGTNGALYTKWQTTACGGWSNWTWIGGNTTGFPVIISHDSSGYVLIGDWGTDRLQWCVTRQNWASDWTWAHCSFTWPRL